MWSSFSRAGSSAGSDSVTSGQRPDGQAEEKSATVSISACAIRLQGIAPAPTHQGDVLRYALLAYSSVDARERRPEEEQRRIDAGIAEVLGRPNVTGWLRLQDVGSATTVRHERG